MRIWLLATISCYIQIPKRSNRQKMVHQILLSKFITNLEYQTCQRIFFLFLHPYVINQVLLGSKLENIYHDKNRNFIFYAWVSGHSDFYSLCRCGRNMARRRLGIFGACKEIAGLQAASRGLWQYRWAGYAYGFPENEAFPMRRCGGDADTYWWISRTL